MDRGTQDIRIADFDYLLPEEKIAKQPLSIRDACKLLRSDAAGTLSHHTFSDLPELLERDTLLVCNNTKVINARLRLEKSTGAQIEVFLLEPVEPAEYNQMFASTGNCRWRCMVGNLKRWKQGELKKVINTPSGNAEITLRRVDEACRDAAQLIDFTITPGNITFAEILEYAGFIPIPPYLNRESTASDQEDYQTVYARLKGSVAAPTAGLHFTPRLLERLHNCGIAMAEVTLHVGAGTFQPVKSDTIGEHPMHTETFSLQRPLLLALKDALTQGRKITAVGTTTVRTLESIPYLALKIQTGKELHVDQWDPYALRSPDAIESVQTILDYMDSRKSDVLTASTAIMIAPGFRWKFVECLITNFHQPQSTLLLLVSSFLEPYARESDIHQWRKAYQEALSSNYRFLSYGDACLFYPITHHDNTL